MGNVNGREDGVGSSSGVNEEGGADGVPGGGGAHDDALGSSYLSRPPPPLAEAMGQSPPHSPRATQSPLMFTPQVSLSNLFFFSRFLFTFGFQSI